MRTFRIADSFDSEKWNPEQMGVVGLSYYGQGARLVAIGASSMGKHFGFLFAWACSKKKYHLKIYINPSQS